MSAFNNNNSNLNNTSAGQAGRVSNMNSTAAHPSGQLNENHGIAATGLNEPHTHANAPTQGKNGLNYSGAPIADTRMVDQQENYGHTAGHDLNSNTNRTGGTGIPPVNTAEHVRRNHAEEALSGNRHPGADNTHHIGTRNNIGLDEKALHGSHGANQHNPISTATHTAGTTGNHNPLSTGRDTGNHNPLSTGHDTGNRNPLSTGRDTGNHNPLSTGNQHQNDHFTTGAGVINQNRNDPTAVGTTGGNHHTGAPLGTGLPNKDQKHVGDQHFNDKRGNLDHTKHDNIGDNSALNKDANKVGAGDKIKGNLEKLSGKITGNETKVIQGENIAQGRSI
ncbi:hypothetical protein HPULCUR_005296 [Helicostylum pulchrum]|uniref:Uncharacterized protein n=1 Tax=Helicostylum pulchrum TaxID=562976 RepID=A0ABP9XYN8_9FUNG